MPRKKREIRAEYCKAGFIERPGKGDHMVYSHPLLHENYVVAGADGKDALEYDEKNLHRAVRALKDPKRQQRQSGGQKP
jgi:hypothetical protein